jgi:pyrroline-5-carboxylate reductase
MIDKKIAFIGAGQMGSALLRGMLQSGAILPERVWVSDKDRGKTSILKKEWGITEAADNQEAVRQADIVLLAVKPQQLDEIAGEIKDALRKDQLLISIIAGMSTKSLGEKLGQMGIVRVMPNSPAMVGRSISVISGGRFSSPSDEKLVGELFSSVGEVVFLEEQYQNRVTALSGSGPAYFYLMVEELIKAGKDVGLTSETAAKLIVDTIVGAAAMLKETGKSPEELRHMVTSPGGTTQAALEVFEKANFSDLIRKAVQAAADRAEELGR